MEAEDRRAEKAAAGGEAGTATTTGLAPARPKLKDRYQIERELGRGGFGVVYLARDEQLHGRPVVIKALLEHGGDQSAWFSKKFREEKEALARLDHPGVVGVLDAGEMPDGTPYLVMQFVDGITLRTALRSGPMPLNRAARIVRQIGQALTAAHERGVCHRDLKPENVMLQELGGGEEQVKIIDFGIATVREAQASTSAEQTRVAGSAPYMAPEQLLGKPSHASDIYALGVITYEMVTGRRPFRPDTLAQMYVLQREGVKVKPAELRRDLPVAAEGAILKALEIETERRHPQARDFGDEFARAAGGGAASVEAPVEESRPPTRRTVLITGVAVLAAGGLTGLVFNRFGERDTSPGAGGNEFRYSITVQKYRDGKPTGEPFVLPGEMIFQADYRIRLSVAGSRPGHLYILNEGPALTAGVPSYNVMFPGAREPAAVGANQAVEIPPGREDWIVFDEQEGTEKLWMIWSAAAVAELEAAKAFAQSEHQGAVTDAARAQAIRAFLAKHQDPAPAAEKDDANKVTRVRGAGDVLVRLVKLEHH